MPTYRLSFFLFAVWPWSKHSLSLKLKTATLDLFRSLPPTWAYPVLTENFSTKYLIICYKLSISGTHSVTVKWANTSSTYARTCAGYILGNLQLHYFSSVMKHLFGTYIYTIYTNIWKVLYFLSIMFWGVSQSKSDTLISSKQCMVQNNLYYVFLMQLLIPIEVIWPL